MIKGYKIFNPDWTCRGMQYTCPGTFKMENSPIICVRGFHFCKKLEDCFTYYCDATSDYHFAEVIAYGEVIQSHVDSICCTNMIEIVREIPFDEILKLTNTGKFNTGYYNSGNNNSGNYNSGNYNTGNNNSGHNNAGHYNTGFKNTGDLNTGDFNTGDHNSGNFNTGDKNMGGSNTGYKNIGNGNVGNRNIGDRNVGNDNFGNNNTGNGNYGNRNTGGYNIGDYNTGDWNRGSYNFGCFNTTSPDFITLFNKPTDLTIESWLTSRAYNIIRHCPSNRIKFIHLQEMTPKELADHPEAETVGGYYESNSYIELIEERQGWWDHLPDDYKNEVMNLPNFDAKIFKECTGIEVRSDEKKD